VRVTRQLALLVTCLLALAIPAGAVASGSFEICGLHRNLETGTGKLYVRVSGPGDLFLEGAGVLPIDREPMGAQTVRFPVVLTGKAKEHLLETGSATVLAKVTYTPDGGHARAKSKRLTLRAALPK
jgi:hypothetical protein